MKKILTIIVLAIVAVLIAPAPAFAQNVKPFPVPWYFASDYGTWGMTGQSPNNYTFFGRTTCNQSAPAGSFFPFAINAKVLIVDAVAANTEVVTPTSIVSSGASCGITAAPTNSHNSFTLKSGTGGLQEALNAIGAGTSGHVALVILDKSWFVFAGQVPGTNAAAIIAAAKGNANIALQDITTAPATYYTWNGTAYVAASYP